MFERILTEPAKTEHFVSIFDHGVHTYRVVKYLLSQNPDVSADADLILLAALVHDVGKLKKDFQTRGSRRLWVHAPHTKEFLLPLLEESSFTLVLQENGLQVPNDPAVLLTICERHHAPDAPLLRDHPEAVLVTVGDAIASMIEMGTTGKLSDLLRQYPYSQVTMAQVKAFGFRKGLDAEVHRVDLPCASVEDVLLSTMIYEHLAQRLTEDGVVPLMQRKSTLWVVGEGETIIRHLRECTLDPRAIYDANFDARIYSTILHKVLATTGAGGLQADQMRFLLVDEEEAKSLGREVLLRDSARSVFELIGLSTGRLEEIVSGLSDVLTDKIRFIATRGLHCLVAGPNAAYHYHRWRSPIIGTLFVKVYPEDLDRCYALLRSKTVFVSATSPRRKDTTGYDRVVILSPSLSAPEWNRRIEAEGLFYLSPEDLIVDLLQGASPDEISEAAAVLYQQVSGVDWQTLTPLAQDREVSATAHAVLAALTAEFGSPFTDHVPQDLLDASRATEVPSWLTASVRKIKDDVAK